MSWTVTPINLRAASEREYAALHQFESQMRAERMPDDPPHTLAEDIANWQNIPPFIDVNDWAVWNVAGTDIIAHGGGGVARVETNQHLLWFGIGVLSAYRRKGIARQLLAPMVALAKCENRRLMMTDSASTVPAGEAALRQLGAEMGLAWHINQLKISELNCEQMREWIARAHDRATEFELGWWVGPYPEADLQTIADLMNVMNSMPRDNLDLEDWKLTPERMRQMEASLAARGMERWTAYVRHIPSGELAGFTEVLWNKHQPTILEQEGTGVWPQYRNAGLGRWLKAAMILRIIAERPQVQMVRTGNAQSNAPMLKINTEMGFKPYCSNYQWQVATEQVEAYLAKG